VDESEWSQMRGSLLAGREALRTAITEHAGDGEDAFGGAVGVIAHAADYLGAIRQKVLVLRGR
jgi:hypothetical protein